MRQVDHATHHLVGVLGVDAQVHRDFDGFVEFRVGAILHQRHGLIDLVELGAFNAVTSLEDALSDV